MKKKYIVSSVFIFLVAVFICSAVWRHNSRTEENEQWCFCNKGQLVNNVKGKKGVDINIANTWKKNQGNDTVIVGVIDSGVDFTCKELKHCIYTNTKEIPNNNVDDDNNNNGFIDDCNGWNFYDNNNVLYSSFTSDYHGTMISGIIAGEHSSKDIFGIAPNVKVLPLKCFKGSEGGIEDVILAINYGYDQGVRIFNCSWDTSVCYDDLKQVMQKYSDAIFICSGGKEVDIYAPGANIYCIMPENTFVYSEGSSLSAAFVTGTIALLKSQEPDISVDQIKQRLSRCYNQSIKLNFLNVDEVCS